MSYDARILIATDSVDNAREIAEVVHERFPTTHLSTNPRKAAADFEGFKPNIILLGFDRIEKSERYYLGLYRTGTDIHLSPHRTIVLCAKESVEQAYRLCREKQFDEYVVYWPLTFDTQRIFMALDHLLEDLKQSAGKGVNGEVIAHARALRGFVPLLDECLTEHEDRFSETAAVIDTAEHSIGAAVEDLRGRLLHVEPGETRARADSARVTEEFATLLSDCIHPQMNSMRKTLQAVRLCAAGLKSTTQAHLGRIEALSVIARQVAPVVVIVDDDAFQCALISQALAGQGFTIRYAATGVRALALLQKEMPALILIDVRMPDMNGIELTRRIKAKEDFANVPIIMITGDSEKRVVMDSLNSGASDFLVKPIDRSVLLDRIQRLLYADTP